MDNPAKPPATGSTPGGSGGSGRSVASTNIMPTKPPAPAPAPAPAAPAASSAPATFTSKQMQQFTQNAQNVNDRGMRMMGIDPLQDPLHPDYQQSSGAAAPAAPAPAPAPAAASNSGIKNNGESYSDLYNAAMNFHRTMARPPSSPGIVADNPYAKGPAPSRMATPQQQSTSSSPAAPADPATPAPAPAPAAPAPADPATPAPAPAAPAPAAPAAPAPAAPTGGDAGGDTFFGMTIGPEVDETYRGDQPVRTIDGPAETGEPQVETGEPQVDNSPSGSGNSLSSMGNWAARQGTATGIVSPLMNAALTREGAQLAAKPTGNFVTSSLKEVAKPYVNMVTGRDGGRLRAAGNYAKSWLPGVTEGGAAGASSTAAANAAGGGGRILSALNAAKGAGGIAAGTAAALPAMGAFTATNGALELVDAAGALPQWAGGTGMGNMGWDQQGFDQQLGQQGAAGNFVSGMMNPLKASTNIVSGVGEGVGAVGNAAYNTVTGTSNKDRAAAKSIADSQEFGNNRAAALGQEAARLKGSQTGPMSYSDENKYNELLAQADDARQRAEAMSDETADWELGNQNWFGGGNKFQDAMNASGEELAGQIESMQDQTLTSAQQANLESLQNRKGEIDRMSKLYDQESGYWGGTGDFGHSVRNNVTQGKQQLINIASEMRQAQGDPERMSQLQRDMQYQNDRLNQYRQWAESANQ